MVMKGNCNTYENPNICIIGAGFSGLCAGIQLKLKLQLDSFTIYESNADVGGVWLVNTYPGCACDIESHLYSYSFAPKTDWTRQYAPQSEILAYLRSIATKFDMYKRIQFKTKVKKLIWHEKIHKWSVRILNTETNKETEIFYDIVINGSGYLREPKIPKEFEEFQGPKFHTAKWDSKVQLDGRTVAVIGSGASAIQVIPNIAHRVSKLLTYQRQPPWVMPKVNMRFPACVKWTFAHVPGVRRTYRSFIYTAHEVTFPTFLVGTTIGKFGHSAVERVLNLLIGLKNKRELSEKLKPSFPFGCKIVLLSQKYYPTLRLPHVKTITSKITEVKQNSIVTEDGNEEKIDVLILATGFKVDEYFAPIDITDRNSQDILSKWKKDGPSAYLGVTSSDMPNYFILLGPGTTPIHNSALFQMECQVNMTIQIINEMINQKSTLVVLKREAELEYMKKMGKAMQLTVFAKEECTKSNTWLADSRGVVVEIYPSCCTSYWIRTRKVNFTKFDFS